MAYSDSEKSVALAALAAHNNDFEETEGYTGIPARTLRHWAAGEHIHPDVAKNAEEKKQALADRLEALAYDIVEAMPAKLRTASLAQQATAMGIAIDKMRLLREEPTSISESKHLDPDEQQRRIDELFDRARERRARLHLADAEESARNVA